MRADSRSKRMGEKKTAGITQARLLRVLKTESVRNKQVTVGGRKQKKNKNEK